MSLYPIIWAAEHAPVMDAEERAILIALVIKGDFDGYNCFRSYRTLAKVARVDVKTAGNRCRAMETRGILRRQQQHAEAHISRAWFKIPEKQRPVVWEVMIPASFWSAVQLAEINEQRSALGRTELTRENRPDLGEAPPKKARADKGVKRPKNVRQAGDQQLCGSEGDPGTTSPYPTDYKSPPQGLEVPLPSKSPSESFSEQTPAVPDAVGKSAGGFESAGAKQSAGGENQQAQGGSAASGQTLPSQRTTSPRPATVKTKPRREAPGFEAVRAAIPAAVAAPGTRLYPGLTRAINDLLVGNDSAGIPRRTPEQVIARMNRRWTGEGADQRTARDYRGCPQCTDAGCKAARQSEANPEGCDRITSPSAWLAATLLGQDCPDAACDDGQLLDGGTCRNCQARHEEARRAAQAVAKIQADWEARGAAHAAAEAALDAWKTRRVDEEKQLRTTLGASMFGERLEYTVRRHMAGWLEHNPQPTGRQEANR